MVSCNDETIIEPLRTLALLGIWFLVGWPLWSSLFTDTKYRVLDLLPFLVNAWSLTGRSYEARLTDWRIWIVNMALAFPLSVASSYAFLGGIDNSQISIAAIALGVSLMGTLPSFHVSIKASENFSRRITTFKVIAFLLVVTTFVWLFTFLDSYRLNDVIPQILAGGCIVVSLLESLAFVRNKNQLGIGSPLIWLSLRFLMTPGIPFFWVWFLLCWVAFEAMNLLQRKRPTSVGAIKGHWRNWQTLPCANSFLSLNLAIGISLLVASGTNTTTTVVLPDNAITTLSASQALQSSITDQLATLCEERQWERLGISHLLDVLNPGFSMSYSREHPLFENNASILAVLLLLLSNIGYVLRTVKDPKSKQGYWQPIFFFAVALMIILFRKEPDESLGLLNNRLTITWAYDSIMAISMALVGGVLSVFVTAFYIHGTAVKRERTRHTEINATSANFTGVVLVALTGASCILSLVYFVLPNDSSVRYTNLTVPLIGLPPEIMSNESDVANWLPYAAYSYLKGTDILVLGAYQACTSYSCLLNESLLVLPNCSISPPNDPLWAVSRDAYTILSTPIPIWDCAVSISLLMRSELIGIGVIQLFTVGLTLGSFHYRALDDIILLGNFASGLILSLAIPTRLLEFRSLVGSTTLIEWNLFTLAIITIVSCAVAVLLRIEVSPTMALWKTADELSKAFLFSDHTSLREFVYNNLGRTISSETPADAFQEINNFVKPKPEEETTLEG